MDTRMARPASRHPTELELDILKIVWDGGPQSTREIREALAVADRGRDLAHTSVITILNIMVKKGYLRRTKDGGAYRFFSCVDRKNVSGGMLDDLVNRVFDGSATSLMLNLLERTDLDDDEIRRLRKMIRRKTKG
jgi:predicted transcriptional regulator